MRVNLAKLVKAEFLVQRYRETHIQIDQMKIIILYLGIVQAVQLMGHFQLYEHPVYIVLKSRCANIFLSNCAIFRI